MGLEEGATWSCKDNTKPQNINFKSDSITSKLKQECPSRGFKIIEDAVEENQFGEIT